MQHLKRLPFLLSPLFLWLFGCEKDETPIIDCSLSDLSVAVQERVSSDCNIPGSIIVSASGGSGSYLFSVDGTNYQTNNTITGLFAGDYTILAKDAQGCIASVSTTLDALPGSVSVSLSITESSCGTNTGSITVSATGGTGPYEYSLNDGTFQATSEFDAVSNGPNTITVRDSEGCEVSRTETVSSGIRLSRDIMPLIATNCAVTGCHNGSRSPDLRTSAGIINSAAKIRARTSAGTMPPASRPDLSATDIAEIACWVDDGAPDN